MRLGINKKNIEVGKVAGKGKLAGILFGSTDLSDDY